MRKYIETGWITMAMRTECPDCNGKGYQEKYWEQAMQNVDDPPECNTCGGKGYIEEEDDRPSTFADEQLHPYYPFKPNVDYDGQQPPDSSSSWEEYYDKNDIPKSERKHASGRKQAERFQVTPPYHGESQSLWYVTDEDGDPVESYHSEEEAEAAAAKMNADNAGFNAYPEQGPTGLGEWDTTDPNESFAARKHAADEGGYNGYANWETWNVALWISNDEELYTLARRAYSYASFVQAVQLAGYTATPDGAAYDDPNLDTDELEELISEL